MKNRLTFLFDGKCPLCLKEVNFLRNKDKDKLIRFVDISSESYLPQDFMNISYSQAMLNLHGIMDDQTIIKGLDVLIFSYELIGMGWLYYPAKIPYINSLSRFAYNLWARNRLKITGRANSLKLCNNDFSNRS